MLPASPLALLRSRSVYHAVRTAPCVPAAPRHAEAAVRAGVTQPASGQAVPVARAPGRLFGGAP